VKKKSEKNRRNIIKFSLPSFLPFFLKHFLVFLSFFLFSLLFLIVPERSNLILRTRVSFNDQILVLILYESKRKTEREREREREREKVRGRILSPSSARRMTHEHEISKYLLNQICCDEHDSGRARHADASRVDGRSSKQLRVHAGCIDDQLLWNIHPSPGVDADWRS